MDALKELYLLYHQDLFRFGKSLTPDEQLIGDALQETFISLWKYRKTATTPASVKPYILKVFRNQVLQQMRGASAVTYTGNTPEFSFEVGFDEKIIEGEDAGRLSQEINNALRKLSSRQRELIYYRFFENLSFEQIGELMNMRTRATYKLAARALAALKQHLPDSVFCVLFLLV